MRSDDGDIYEFTQPQNDAMGILYNIEITKKPNRQEWQEGTAIGYYEFWVVEGKTIFRFKKAGSLPVDYEVVSFTDAGKLILTKGGIEITFERIVG